MPVIAVIDIPLTEMMPTKAKPVAGLLVLYHRGNPRCDQAGGASGSEEEMLREIREHYPGKVVAAHDSTFASEGWFPFEVPDHVS